MEFCCYCGGGLERGGGASVGDGGEEGHGVVFCRAVALVSGLSGGS